MPRLSPNLKNISSKEEEEEEEIKITHRTFCFIDRTVTRIRSGMWDNFAHSAYHKPIQKRSVAREIIISSIFFPYGIVREPSSIVIIELQRRKILRRPVKTANRL